MTKPWMSRWVASSIPTWRVTGPESNRIAIGLAEETTRLIASAPALARALCWVEWGGHDNIGGIDESYYVPACPACDSSSELKSHKIDCVLDLALSAAGLDAAAREEVRRMGK